MQANATSVTTNDLKIVQLQNVTFNNCFIYVNNNSCPKNANFRLLSSET